MDYQPAPEASIPDTDQITKAMSEMAEIGERSQRLVSDFFTRQAEKGMTRTPDPMNIGQAFMEMTAAMMTDPAKMVRAQMALWQDYMDLWKSTSERMMGLNAPQVAEPDKGDRRFRDGAWSENEVFNFIKQSYLLTSRWLRSTVREVDGLEDETAKDRKSTRLNSSHTDISRMPSSA